MLIIIYLPADIEIKQLTLYSFPGNVLIKLPAIGK